MNIPKNHPRHKSLTQRHLIEDGLANGIVAPAGLIAHGRGEAFYYLLGEKTTEIAKVQIRAAAAKLLLAKRPVISVNGNVTALCAKEIVQLSKQIPAQIEVNLFYKTPKRVKLIAKEFAKHGVKILGQKPTKSIPNLSSKRNLVDEKGIWGADVVLVMLEDGDRTQSLLDIGKEVIAIDLNPLSRTAICANITIVDNVTECIPRLSEEVKKIKAAPREELNKIVKNFDNKKSLKETEHIIRSGNP